MISPIQQKISTRLTDSNPIAVIGLPPKDPDDNEDENEEDDGEEEEEPAVIREPDE
jgi:hypothetical protein